MMNILKLLHPKACIEYIYDDCTARQTLEKMKNHGYSAVPVINREGRFVKTVSEGDFLRFMVERGMYDIREMESYPLEKIPAKVKMRPVNVSATVEKLILLSMDQNFVPVIDDRGIFIGIVTRKDILSYCYDTIMAEKHTENEEDLQQADI